MNSLVKYVLENGGKDYNIMYPQHELQGKYCSCNSTCIWTNEGLLINSRAINYRKLFQNDDIDYCSDKANQTYIFNNNGVYSRNLVMMYKNGDFRFLGETEYSPSVCSTYYMGLEDCRFVSWNQKIYAYGTRWDKVQDKGCICIHELDYGLNPVKEIIVEPLFNSVCEKNWLAVQDQPFTFIYTVNPTVVIKVDENGKANIIKQEEHRDDLGTEFIKGNTPLVRYSENEYISLIHITPHDPNATGNVYNYYTAFIFFDNDFNVTRKSDWFVFKSELCEFCCGLSINGDGKVAITYSQFDGVSNLLLTDKKTIEKFMNEPNIDRNDVYTFDYYYDLAHEYENNGQFSAACILYNYCSVLAIRENKSYELRLECIVRGFCSILIDIDTVIVKELYQTVNNCIWKQIPDYPDSCELYYLSAYLYKDYDWERYLECKKMGDERILNIHNYFFRYFDPIYL